MALYQRLMDLRRSIEKRSHAFSYTLLILRGFLNTSKRRIRINLAYDLHKVMAVLEGAAVHQ